MEIECDFDWEKLTGILDKAPIESEYIEYKGIKYIKEQYCVPKSKIKEKIEEQYELFNTPNRQKEYSQEVVDILQELMEDK